MLQSFYTLEKMAAGIQQDRRSEAKAEQRLLKVRRAARDR